mmetsp:Transcript_97181/g.274888  ORF Transcript_97181/g.274888 Transcript_97181/m.274888 type:complete len:549 (-) Transcript_97181:3378-5024(-)
MDLLPQVSSEDLDERNLQGWDLAVHEDAREVQLHLEAHVDVGTVDGRRPPQREAPVRDLVEARPLGVGQLLETHGLLEAACLLPEETLPGREVGALEEGVLQDALHAAQGLDHVCAVVVQVPQLPVVPLVGPPEGVVPHDVVLLEVLAYSPALVEGQGVPVLLEEGVDARDPTVPGILQVLQGQAPVLRIRLLTLQGILGPHTLAVDELGLPRLDVPVQVRNQLVLLMAQATAVVGDACLRLLGVSQVRLRDQDVSHAQHSEATQLLRRVEHHRRETRGHLGVQADLDAGLDLVLTLHQQVQKRVRVNDGLTEVRGHADEVRVPLVGDLREGRGAGGHQDRPAAVLELLLGLVVDLEERLCGHLLGRIVLQLPHALTLRELLLERADLGQDADLEAAHVEEHVGVVLRVNRGKGVVPHEVSDAPWQPVLHLPEDSPAQIHVVLHPAHAAVARPAHLVVVAHHVLIVGVWVLRQEALNEVARLLLRETEDHNEAVQITAVQPDGVAQLRVHVLEGQELIRQLRRPRQLRGAREAELQQVQDEAVILEDK